MQFEPPLHTIFLCVGPTNSGKSYFSQNIIIPKLTKVLQDNNIRDNIQYVSSDNIRRMMINQPEMDKYAVSMCEASHQAFNMLYSYVDAVTTFPVNAHFVILDTTGLSKEYRDKINQIAKKNNYNIEVILFNFTNVQDYFKNGGDKEVIDIHVKKLRNTVIKEISKEFSKKHIIKSHLAPEQVEVKIADIDLYKKCLLDPEMKYLVIGDIHTCIDECKQLIINAGFTIDETGLIHRSERTQKCEIISLGDLVDKGSKTKETIEFFYMNVFDNKEVQIKIVRGNHDNAVMRLLTGKTKDDSYDTGFV